ncbi:MAG: hypothetical protein ACK4SQ_07875 [Allorhizobium sp.]
MSELSETELATALILGLQRMDHNPRCLPRTAEERDAARRLAQHIISLVPDMTNLASICMSVWAKEYPNDMKEVRGSYAGPDVFRDLEFYQYPDDSGCDEDDCNPPSWAERAGLEALCDQFHDKALLEWHSLHERYKRDKAIAARQKRLAKAKEKREEDERNARRGEIIQSMMASTTAPSSGLLH